MYLNLFFLFLVEIENQATISNILPESRTSETKDVEFPCDDDVTSVGVTRVHADERVGEYAVPRVSYFVARKTNVDETDVEFGHSEEQISEGQELEESGEHLTSEAEVFESKNESIEEDLDNTDFTIEMNGNTQVEDTTDGVKELAASFQHAIQEETAKAKPKGRPPPVKPKSYKKAPPPLVAPKPKANGIKINKPQQSPTGMFS